MSIQMKKMADMNDATRYQDLNDRVLNGMS